MAVGYSTIATVVAKDPFNTSAMVGLGNIPAGGADRLLLLLTACRGVGQHTSVVVTGGTTMTYGFRFNDGHEHEFQVWYAKHAAIGSSGSQSMIWTPSVTNNGAGAMAMFTGVDQTTPFSALTQDNDKSFTFVGSGTSGNEILDMGAGQDGFNFSVTQAGSQANERLDVGGGGSDTESSRLYLGSGGSLSSYNCSITYGGVSIAYGAIELYAVGQAGGGGGGGPSYASDGGGVQVVRTPRAHVSMRERVTEKLNGIWRPRPGLWLPEAYAR